jgi:histidine phosphotransferase ChpT
MKMQIDLKVAQLLSSRICHDLVGSIGAVNAGLELMAEGLDADGAAKELTVRSANEANLRLAFFRAAFGCGSSALVTAGWNSALEEARTLAEGLLKNSKVKLEWQSPPLDMVGPAIPTAIKIILNLVLMAFESLPRGGKVRLSFAMLKEGFGVGLTFSGEGATLRDDLIVALKKNKEVEVDALSARNIHAYLAQCLAFDLDAFIEHSEGSNGQIQLAILFPITSD